MKKYSISIAIALTGCFYLEAFLFRNVIYAANECKLPEKTAFLTAVSVLPSIAFHSHPVLHIT